MILTSEYSRKRLLIFSLFQNGMNAFGKSLVTTVSNLGDILAKFLRSYHQSSILESQKTLSTRLSLFLS